MSCNLVTVTLFEKQCSTVKVYLVIFIVFNDNVYLIKDMSISPPGPVLQNSFDCNLQICKIGQKHWFKI